MTVRSYHDQRQIDQLRIAEQSVDACIAEVRGQLVVGRLFHGFPPHYVFAAGASAVEELKLRPTAVGQSLQHFSAGYQDCSKRHNGDGCWSLVTGCWPLVTSGLVASYLTAVSKTRTAAQLSPFLATNSSWEGAI